MLKVMCIISWCIIGVEVFGVLLLLNDGEFDLTVFLGMIIFAFYGTMTYKIQQLMKKE